MTEGQVDVAVVGGGIVGLATAMALVEGRHGSVVVLEAEEEIARHQTGHNSGVIHSGLYYKPGSLKARLCAEGRESMFRFCAEHGVPHERTGKLVVATSERELPFLDELERRGRANGLPCIERLRAEQIREREPYATGIAGLWISETGIASFAGVAAAMASQVRAAGGEVVTGARFLACARENGAIALETTRGTVRCRVLVGCAGLHSDRVARACGVDPGVRIAPFRGEYYLLKRERRELVRNLIYPVPDPRFPFLGVHFTRRVGGEVEAGPNAVLAWRREGYEKTSVSLADMLELAAWPGFWRMASRHWRTGMAESWRSAHKTAFVRALQKLIPEIRDHDVEAGRAGVRAQALGRDGALIDDFHLVETDRMLHVVNAPSPAATASIGIGRHLASRVARRLEG